MYQFYPPYQMQQQYLPRYNQPYQQPSSIISPPLPRNSQLSAPLLYPPQSRYANNLSNRDPRSLSEFELSRLLDKQTDVLKELHAKDQQKQLPVIIDVVAVLVHIPRAKLVSAAQNEFFSLLRVPFIDILNQASQFSTLSNDEFYVLRAMVKLMRRIIKNVDDLTLVPSWFSDLALLEAISISLTNIATSDDVLQDKNRALFKPFTRLIETYLLYQQLINQYNHSSTDTLQPLMDSIVHCLTSSHFIDTFTSLRVDAKSMTTIEKFFLVKCPAFLSSYDGSHLEQIMDNLLSTMISQYAQLLERSVASVRIWRRSIMRAVDHLFQLISHGANQFPTNAKHVSEHLSLIDSALKLVNEPMIYKNLQGTLSNPETTLMNTVVSFLVHMIIDPSILAHIKQSQMTSAFLRLTMCAYEPLVFNVYALLAYTTHEEDIKAMPEPGLLFAAIVKSLKTTLKQASNNKSHNEQLLETLKGLVQHDQMKDEVIKQNALPFLLECTNKLTDRAQILILETLWSLTFREESASALRSNSKFLRKIQNISLNSRNEPLKKAADGLVWKLVREPQFLQKVAEQEEEEEEEEQKATTESLASIIEEVVNIDGQKQRVRRVKPLLNNSEERTFPYDIMISYCHADKELTYKIHRFLIDVGFKVWIDLDNMYGPAMNAMAEAVENSEFIIMCMSDSYKQSTYCQAEAEYAFKCKRRLIPLIMRPGYRPDGWLGFMIGSRIYVDFGRFDFKTACEKLLTEISLQRKQPLPPKAIGISEHHSPPEISSNDEIPAQDILPYHVDKSVPSSVRQKKFQIHLKRKASSNFTRKPVIRWTPSDVLDFLYIHRLVQLMPLCDGMDGGALLQLYKMCLSRSSKTFGLLGDELRSTFKIKLPIAIYTRFISAIEQRQMLHPDISLQTQPILAIAPSTRPVTPIVSEYLPATTYIPSTPYVPPTPKLPVIDNLRVQTPLNFDQDYDLVITSNAPALTVLEAVTRYGADPEKMSSFLTHRITRF